MLIPQPPQRPPVGHSPLEFAAHKMLRDAITPLSRTYTPRMRGGTLPTMLTELVPFCDAIIGAQGGSGSGGGSGNPLPANDQANAYEWVEAMWVVVADDIVFVPRPGGLKGTFDSLPAIEANGVTDVPEGVVVQLWADAAGAAEFYKFWWTGEEGGSGSGDGMTITCADGSQHPVTISGNSITVGDAI